MKVSSLALLATVGAGRTFAFLAPATVQLGRQSKVVSPSHNNHFFVVSDPVSEHAVTDARTLVDSQDASASETANEIPTMMTTTTTTTTPTTATTTTTKKTDRAATSGANAPIVPYVRCALNP